MSDEKKGQEPVSLVKSPEFLALNPRQKKFVMQYIKTGNATQSYIFAYGDMRDNVAAAGAVQLLRNINVSRAVALGQLQTDLAAEKQIIMDKAERMEILAKISRANVKNVVRFRKGSVEFKSEKNINDDDLIAIKSFSFSSSSGSQGSSRAVSFSTHDRVKAIELLGKMMGDMEADDSDRDNKPVDAGFEDRMARLRAKYSAKRG